MSKIDHVIEAGVDEYGEWNRPYFSTRIRAIPQGWKGVWEVFKAAWRKQGFPLVTQEVSFSVYIKKPADELYVWGEQLESGKQEEVKE